MSRLSLPLILATSARTVTAAASVIDTAFGGLRSIIGFVFKSNSPTTDAAINDVAGEIASVEGTARSSLIIKTNPVTTDAAVNDVAVTLGA
jgi:hypothetical protein